MYLLCGFSIFGRKGGLLAMPRMSKQTVCRCTCRKSVPEGEAGSDESKGCWRRYRKAYATKGKGKRSNYVTNIYCCISHHLDNVLIVKNSGDMKCVGKMPYTSLLLTRIRLGLI